MKHVVISCLIAFALTSASPALAGKREYSTGVNHIKIYNPPAKENAAQAQKPETKEDAASRVWNKYKALAMGTAGEEETTKEPKQAQKVKAPAKPSKPKKPQKTGMVSLIETYQKNKENRRDMRSLSFSTPQPSSASPPLQALQEE